MSSWRSCRSRSSARSLPHATTYPLSGYDDPNPPPRYSNLASIAEPQVTLSHSSAPPPVSVDYAERAPLQLSAISLGPQILSPLYTARENGLGASLVSPSTITLTNPPRYSSLLQTAQAGRDGPDLGRRAVSTSEYAFDILGGFKSERWATLRLCDTKSPIYRSSTEARHPRFSNMDAMLGNVELHLSSPRTIGNIELTLKGSIITGSLEDGKSTKFLEQGYTLWDRKYGDPRLLAHDNAHLPSKYDGKFSGGWIFPFSIPFPTHVDLATLRAVYPREGEGPVRFLPEPLHDDSPLTPFDLSGRPTGMHSSLHYAPVHPPSITPFNVRTPSMAAEKGGLVLYYPNSPPQGSTSHSSPISPPSPAAPNTPSLEPYTLTHRPFETSNPSSPSSDHATKSDHSPPDQASPTRDHRQPRGATGMHDPEPPTSTTCYPLPQSFLEEDVMVIVRYKMTLAITHGRFPIKSRVSTPVIYAPTTTLPSMILGQQIAYRRRDASHNPVLDLDGWKQLPPVSIRGIFDDQTTLAVHYRLSLPTPLSYARGTVIPCHLMVSCDDVSALNLFANPRTPRVRLRRSVRFLQNQAGLTQGVGPSWDSGSANLGNIAPNRHRLSSTLLRLTQLKRNSGLQPGQATDITPFTLGVGGGEEEETLQPSDRDDEQEIGDGCIWSTPAGFTQEPRVRRLYGEIRLPRELQPTCKSSLFNILYHVELLAPATKAFVPDAQRQLSPGKGKAKVTRSENGREGGHAYISQYVELITGPWQDEQTATPSVMVRD